MKKSFKIGRRWVGDDYDLFVIAEAGVAHFGRMDLAWKLLEMAASAGADAFKCQVFDVDQLFSGEMKEWKERLRPRNLEFKQIKELKDECDRRHIEFLLTPHDESRISWIQELDLPAIKVGSGEKGNFLLLKKLAALGKPLIISTGMHNENEVRKTVEFLQEHGCNELALMHCVTAYPIPPKEVNLRSIIRLKEIFDGPVGYSDHTTEHLAMIGAVALGAAIVERHISVLRDVPNAQDWKVSSSEQDFPGLVRELRTVRTMLGNPLVYETTCEKESEYWALKHVVAARDLPGNAILQKDDLMTKRSGRGMSASQLDSVVGRSLVRPLHRDEPIELGDIR